MRIHHECPLSLKTPSDIALLCFQTSLFSSLCPLVVAVKEERDNSVH